MAWLVLAYLGSLTTMFLSAFWSVDSFTGKVIKNFSLANFQTLFTQSVYARLALRSLSVALIVTLKKLTSIVKLTQNFMAFAI